jgi:hypothetical protein
VAMGAPYFKIEQYSKQVLAGLKNRGKSVKKYGAE